MRGSLRILKTGPCASFRRLEIRLACLGVEDHRAELVELERPAAEARHAPARRAAGPRESSRIAIVVSSIIGADRTSASDAMPMSIRRFAMRRIESGGPVKMVMTGCPSISSTCARARIRSATPDTTRSVIPCSSQSGTMARSSGCPVSSGTDTKTSSIAWLARSAETRSRTLACPTFSCRPVDFDHVDDPVAEVGTMRETARHLQRPVAVADDDDVPEIVPAPPEPTRQRREDEPFRREADKRQDEEVGEESLRGELEVHRTTEERDRCGAHEHREPEVAPFAQRAAPADASGTGRSPASRAASTPHRRA